MIGMKLYRIYETGTEIDLPRLERQLAAAHAIARARFVRMNPKSIVIDEPPLLLRLDPVTIDRQGIRLPFSVQAKIYDIGAISVILIYETPAEPPALSPEALAAAFSDQSEIDAVFTTILDDLERILQPHTGPLSINPGFYEDYTIFRSDRLDQVKDPVQVLMGEQNNFSQQIRDEMMQNALSYTKDDIAILSWDTALICDREDPLDLMDLIEYANVQLLELRYYDEKLTRQMAQMYTDIDSADRLNRFSRLKLYHSIMKRLMELYADITEIKEKINNLIKITEDVFYAKVYASALRVLRIQQWSEGVNRKIDLILQNYTMLSNEVNVQHSNFLEWMIIVLITLEFALAIWQTLF